MLVSGYILRIIRPDGKHWWDLPLHDFNTELPGSTARWLAQKIATEIDASEDYTAAMAEKQGEL